VIRKQQLAGVDIEPGQRIVRSLIRNRKDRSGSAEAAETPGRAAASHSATATATASATATAATTAGATAAAAAAASATPRHLLQRAAVVFLVEQVERREADVGDFFFAQCDSLGRREVEFLRDIRGRHG
jgi:hypothetical protein